MKKEKKVEEGSQGPYPKSVFFIIGNEFCERFSFYGMRTILVVYLTQILLYSDNNASLIFHAFTMACYFTPVLGAIIADSWLGKFKTILYISIIYAFGNILISVGSIPSVGSHSIMNILTLVGLGLIAVGTGGIKPCVSAFGGDQFEAGQELYLQKFFSFFYMSINLGSTISTFLTPVLRTDVHCFGEKTCFPVAFGVPAVLMLTSLVLFLIGKPLYKLNPPEGNVMVKVGKCIWHAISRKFSSQEKKKDHWLDYADDSYDQSFIKGVKTILSILFLYLPLPVFWALFDQQGSKWTLQALRMDGRFFGYTIKPDQMQVFNPLLVIGFIPLFEYCIYPVFRKCSFLVKPLQRITVGGLLAALSFVLAAFLQIAVEQTMPVPIPEGSSETTVINNSPCEIIFQGSLDGNLSSYQEITLQDIPLGQQQAWEVSSLNCGDVKPVSYNFTAQYSYQTMMITLSDGKLDILTSKSRKEKVETGNANLTIFYNIPDLLIEDRPSLILQSSDKAYEFSPSSAEMSTYGITSLLEVEPGIYKVCFKLKDSPTNENTCTEDVLIEPGAIYVEGVYQNPLNATDVHATKYVLVKANNVHILYQVPQYLVITAGEIMFSITGLEFSYSQAPKSMKSVLQAAWLLTVAFGDLIVVLVASSNFFKEQSKEFFMFAGLMGLDMIVFAIMAAFYKYVDSSELEEEKDEKPDPKTNGETNQGYVEDTKF